MNVCSKYVRYWSNSWGNSLRVPGPKVWKENLHYSVLSGRHQSLDTDGRRLRGDDDNHHGDREVGISPLLSSDLELVSGSWLDLPELVTRPTFRSMSARSP